MSYDAASIQSAYAFFTGNAAPLAPAYGQPVYQAPVYQPSSYVPAQASYPYQPQAYAPQQPVQAYNDATNQLNAQLAQLEAAAQNMARQIQGAFTNGQATVASYQTPPFVPSYAPAMPAPAPSYPQAPSYYPQPPAPYQQAPVYRPQGQNNGLMQILQTVSGVIQGIQQPQQPQGFFERQRQNYDQWRMNNQMQNAVNGVQGNLNQVANSFQQAFAGFSQPRY